MSAHQKFEDDQALTILDNGMHVMTRTLRQRPVVAMKVLVDRAGLYYEPPDQPHISHHLEHVISKGHAREGSFKNYAQYIEQKGYGFFGKNARTTGFHITYAVNRSCDPLLVLKEDWRDVFQRNLDAIFFPHFDAGIVERERKAVENEIRQKAYKERNNTLLQYATEAERLYYPGSGQFMPTAHEYSGAFDKTHYTPGHLQEYWEKHYHPGAILVAVCGDISHDEVVAVCSQSAYDRQDFPLARRRFDRFPTADADVRHHNEGAGLCNVRIMFDIGRQRVSWKGRRTSYFYHALMDACLNERLRAKDNPDYGISPAYEGIVADEQGYTYTQIGCNPANLNPTLDMIADVSEALFRAAHGDTSSDDARWVSDKWDAIRASQKKFWRLIRTDDPSRLPAGMLDFWQDYGILPSVADIQAMDSSVTLPDIAACYAKALTVPHVAILAHGNISSVPSFDAIKSRFRDLGASYAGANADSSPSVPVRPSNAEMTSLGQRAENTLGPQNDT